MKAQWGTRGIRAATQLEPRRDRPHPSPKPVDAAVWRRLAVCERDLVATPTWGHLAAYQAEVRRMLRNALTAGAATVDVHYSPQGRFYRVMYVREVNQALQALVEEVLQGRSGTDLVARIDGIRGLLINLMW